MEVFNNNNNNYTNAQNYKNCAPPKTVLDNPFVRWFKIGSTKDKIKIAVGAVFILPIRIFLMLFFVILTWVLASILTFGLSMEDLNREPITGWRKKIRTIARNVFRLSYMAATFQRVRIKGVQATAKEAPILVIAPHSSFFDTFIGPIFKTVPIVVAKAEVSRIPFIGRIMTSTQAIYVQREDPNSRENAIVSIKKRIHSKQDWAQIMIFPEGQCSNRSSLVTFKPGAFASGAPIQPVLIRYDGNEMDSFTWTFEGTRFVKMLFVTLTKLSSEVEIEFMPVYQPNEEEQKDPKLYAYNVRNVMARALDFPVSDYCFSDCIMMSRAKEMNIPHFRDTIEVKRLRASIGLSFSNAEEQIIQSSLVNDSNCMVSYSEFCSHLQISPSHQHSIRLFAIFDKTLRGKIDFREYLFCALFIIKYNEQKSELIRLTFSMYENLFKSIGLTAFVEIMGKTMAMAAERAVNLFSQIKKSSENSVSFDEFISFAKSTPEFKSLFRIPSNTNGQRIR